MGGFRPVRKRFSQEMTMAERQKFKSHFKALLKNRGSRPENS
jgi:hypothetical protein